MLHRSLTEVVPLLSSRLLLPSRAAGAPCRSYSALARAFANPYVPCNARYSPWSLAPFEDMKVSYPSATFTNTSMASYMRQMVSQFICVAQRRACPTGSYSYCIFDRSTCDDCLCGRGPGRGGLKHVAAFQHGDAAPSTILRTCTKRITYGYDGRRQGGQQKSDFPGVTPRL